MATAAPAKQLVTYKDYGPVTVLGVSGTKTQITTSNDNTFWVPTDKLKYKTIKVHETVTGRFQASKPNFTEVERKLITVDTVKIEQAVAATGDFGSLESIDAFVQFLEATGYTLIVHVRHDGLELVEAEYRQWCGEELSGEAIRHYENKPVQRQWRLGFTLSNPETKLPFPVDIMGTTGRRPTVKPRGLIQGKYVVVYFASIIEELVRAGLRVTI